jgi:branched-chain amino acid transport system substrate-binding protein
MIFIPILIVIACAPVQEQADVIESPEVMCEETLQRFNNLVAEKDHRNIRREGRFLLEKCPGSVDEAEIRIQTGSSCIELGFFEEASSILADLTDEDADKPTRAAAYSKLADIDIAKGRFENAAEKLITVMTLADGSPIAGEARETLSGIIPLLSREELAALVSAYPSLPGMDLILNRSLVMAVEAGDTSTAADLRIRLSNLESEHPVTPVVEGSEIDTRIDNLSTLRLPADGNRIGLLCPLTGRFSALGKEFLMGASVAVREAREYGIDTVELVVGDTKSNALETREAALRLIEEEKVSAIVGSVLSSTTITAAQTAQHKGVVLYSTVASEDGIGDIGDHIFQITTGYEVEIAAVARIACTQMKLRRIAVLGANTTGTRRIVSHLESEIDGLGGMLCSVELYEPGSTDFKLSIERMRNTDPDALFLPSESEDLILILPQLSFYEFGVQLLGTSEWDSRRLIRMVGRDMEGAVFPARASGDSHRERYLAAAVLIGDTSGEANRFAIGGYIGVREIIEVMMARRESGLSIRDELDKKIGFKRHPFLELADSGGIQFKIIRNEASVNFITLGGDR